MTPTDQFHRHLLDCSDGKSRVGLEAVREAFQRVHPELATAPSARAKLRGLLDVLELDERIQLPKGRHLWDASTLPSLPQWVRLPPESSSSEKPDLRAVPWCPELRFLATTRVFVPLSDLLKLQDFLAHGGRERPTVPIKERSLDIFGDEKRLDQLVRGSALFGDGRLTPETLRCSIVPEPLPWKAGPDPTRPLLVVENAATWHSYCRWNAARGLFCAVVYGCGNRFMDSATFILEIFEAVAGPRRVLYFGDLDPQGLVIPQEASARGQTAGLPTIEPHLWSYRHLLAVTDGHGQAHDAPAPAPTLCDWLGDCAESVRRLFAAGRRLAQEHIGWEFLRNHLTDDPAVPL